MSWSGGKDSALALYRLLQAEAYHVRGLLTTVTEDYARISMHGVRHALLEAQAEALGLPLEVVWIPRDASQEEYERRMSRTLDKFRAKGIHTIAFGDIFLEDVRCYREQNLARAGMAGLFPLWGQSRHALVEEFFALGFKSIITCVDGAVLSGAFAGQELNAALLDKLPDGVDRCGENGEYHSFVFDGPIFRTPVPFQCGEVVLRDGRFYYCELLPAGYGVSGSKRTMRHSQS